MPVLEAMASGLPVVCSACMGVEHFAVHGHNALIAASHDAPTMASHMEQLLASPALAAGLARHGRRTALRCGLDAMADALEDALTRTHDFFGRRCPQPPVLMPAAASAAQEGAGSTEQQPAEAELAHAPPECSRAYPIASA